MGCGSGLWVRAFQDFGVTDVRGVDGTHLAPAELRIPPELFRAHDLATPLDLGRRFDLVVSLEVAEHLPTTCSETFVESIARHGDAVLFSAAPPWQTGPGHVNEQWPSYWIALFAQHSFEPFDLLRPIIWSDERVHWYYRQNILLFGRGERAERLREVPPPPPIFDYAHPEMVVGRIRASTKALAKALPVVAWNNVRHRMSQR
jgi:hypothetical protein